MVRRHEARHHAVRSREYGCSSGTLPLPNPWEVKLIVAGCETGLVLLDMEDRCFLCHREGRVARMVLPARSSRRMDAQGSSSGSWCLRQHRPLATAPAVMADWWCWGWPDPRFVQPAIHLASSCHLARRCCKSPSHVYPHGSHTHSSRPDVRQC